MPVRREWEDDAGWVDTIVCRYCFEDATDDGPYGNGNDRVALLRHRDGRVWAFCSPACRRRWVDVVFADGFDDADARYDDVDVRSTERTDTHDGPVA